jgi:hypothetical protein
MVTDATNDDAAYDDAQWIVWPRAAIAAHWLATELVALEAVARGSREDVSVWDEPLVEPRCEDPLADASTGTRRGVSGDVARRMLRWTTARGIDSALAVLESRVAAARRRIGGGTRHLER